MHHVEWPVAAGCTCSRTPNLCRVVHLQVLESSYEANEPLCFEVGAGDMMGNKLFQVGQEMQRGPERHGSTIATHARSALIETSASSSYDAYCAASGV